MDTDEILKVALCFVDRVLTEDQLAALKILCGAAADLWESRLRDELDPADMQGLFSLACAYTALEDFWDGTNADGQSSVDAFRLGEFSVTGRTASSSAPADRKNLRAKAAALMAPFTQDWDFAFREVVG